ncbi:MAG: tyrosine-type recombinase/integrase [Brevundimonas sp.]|uniref:tyrosine-type recombinase/integrase n=1 Tax=Brevundimonas sp. TaxID=1871086 RepID=UPI002637323B|nr:site-specific integrase [Brevundimonas sp.]MDI6623184.1 tyrosine-type recombinase/integrase [Brevundimonas sp.]MDQ7811215.1 tyrosine-type recombinase/integrase [Brevundimonas sp.]
MASGRRVERITKRTVDGAKPGERLYRLWDTDLKGFGVRVTPGGVKSYIVAYRPNGGGRSVSQQEFTIARHGVLTPDEAREEAAKILATVRHGGDPQAARSASRKELTISELCNLYLAEGVATKKASTLATDRVRIERHIKPLLGRKLISAVTDADVERFIRDVAAGKTAVDRKPTRVEAKGRKVETRKRTDPVARGGRGAATRTAGLLGGIFTFAVKRKLLTTNPVTGVKRFRDGESQRFLSAAELGRLGSALANLDANRKALAIIRLLVLTGARRGEIEALRWSEVDMDRGCLRLGDSKTGAKVIPLGPPALVVLEGVDREKGSPFVFPATGRPKKHFIGTAKVWNKARQLAGLEDVRIHDLRHTYASLAASGGQSLPLIGKLLGHRDVKTTARYAHLADDPVQAAADRTAESASAALAGTVGEVVPFRRQH